MTRLSIHPDHDPASVLMDSSDRVRIAEALRERGVRFEHLGRPGDLHATDSASVLASCADLVTREQARHGYTAVDAVSVSAATPDLPTVRGRFLSEHTHAEDEARYMVEGGGTFYLRSGAEVLMLELTAGDLISVPEGMRHWFDMGERPHFTAVRFFTRPDGWVGAFTGDPIADRFPRYAGPT
jgi:1,2-dihydroxy-3-keto-5-methylthiopentene dioxygenase